MEPFDPQILGAMALSSGLAVAMLWLANRMNMLEQRRDVRCPACGRLRRRDRCGCSA